MQNIKTTFNYKDEKMIAAIYSTMGNIEDAKKIAHSLVEEKLVACESNQFIGGKEKLKKIVNVF